MYRKKLVVSVTLLAVLVAIFGVLLFTSAAASANGTSGAVVAAGTPEPPNGDVAPTPTGPGYAQGVPAIKHVGNGTTPTSDEVKQFVLSHKFPLDATATGKPSAILDIEFITASACSAKLHGESIGIPDSNMVIYVKVHGPFTFTAMSLPPQYKGGPPQVQDAVEVFDAATGNLLLVGTV